jgi:hypothetical protein
MLPGQFCYPSLFREHGIRLLCPGRVSLRRLYPWVSPSLPWVLPGGVSQVPRYYATLRLPRTRTQRLMDSSLGSSPSPRLRSVRYEDAACRLAPLFPVRRRGTVSRGWEYGDLTGSWDAPSVPLPCSLTPAGPPHPTGLGVSVLPPYPIRRRLPRVNNFGAPSHGFGTRCLRFAADIAAGPRTTRLRLVVNLYREGLEPSGHHSRFPFMMYSRTSSFPSFSCRTLGLFRTFAPRPSSPKPRPTRHRRELASFRT